MSHCLLFCTYSIGNGVCKSWHLSAFFLCHYSMYTYRKGIWGQLCALAVRVPIPFYTAYWYLKTTNGMDGQVRPGNFLPLVDSISSSSYADCKSRPIRSSKRTVAPNDNFWALLCFYKRHRQKYTSSTVLPLSLNSALSLVNQWLESPHCTPLQPVIIIYLANFERNDFFFFFFNIQPREINYLHISTD